jgi:hypothetical protein
MLERLLPRSIDNTYRGRKPALWIFGLIVLMTLAIGINSIFNGWSVLTTADGIPLATYPPAAAHTIVSIWALLGLSRVVLSTLCLFVLVRYRTMIPFLFTLFLLQHLAGELILRYLPLATTGTPPGSAINLAFLTLTLLGLLLSLWHRRG